ncbi:Hypothetical protein NTJ_04101 [Nesidiocoris tenuis]|uniref:Uncharacterized protein n=1 Tax=Nesidiocoris tenuis TaxID=355587 RepID=A0ABN7AJ60_9HEMI|nr:Hypothetical protein NTJ_04101 [Nesidiocoris tenuis]
MDQGLTCENRRSFTWHREDAAAAWRRRRGTDCNAEPPPPWQTLAMASDTTLTLRQPSLPQVAPPHSPPLRVVFSAARSPFYLARPRRRPALSFSVVQL